MTSTSVVGEGASHWTMRSNTVSTSYPAGLDSGHCVCLLMCVVQRAHALCVFIRSLSWRNMLEGHREAGAGLYKVKHENIMLSIHTVKLQQSVQVMLCFLCSLCHYYSTHSFPFWFPLYLAPSVTHPEETRNGGGSWVMTVTVFSDLCPSFAPVPSSPLSSAHSRPSFSLLPRLFVPLSSPLQGPVVQVFTLCMFYFFTLPLQPLALIR